MTSGPGNGKAELRVLCPAMFSVQGVENNVFHCATMHLDIFPQFLENPFRPHTRLRVRSMIFTQRLIFLCLSYRASQRNELGHWG